MNSWRAQFELNFSSGATTEYHDGVGFRRARRIVVVAAGELDRRLEVEGADLDADRIERRSFRHHDGGAAAARSGADRRDVIGRRALARDAARRARNREPRRRAADWRPAIRSATAATEVAAPGGACGLALLAGLVVPALSLPALPFRLALAFGLALAGGVEAGGAGAGRRLEGGGRRASSARAFLALPRWKRAGLFGSPSSSGRSSAELLSAKAPAPVATRRRTPRRNAEQRPDTERESERRKAKARHPVTPGPDRARFPLDACPARAEKCVSDQSVPQISTALGGPPGWAVRGSRALWLMELKRIWLTGR